MDIKDYNSDQFVDIFNIDPPAGNDPTGTAFRAGTDPIGDLSIDPKKDDPNADVLDAIKTDNPDADVNLATDADEPAKRGPGRPRKDEIRDLSGYFSDRIKAGKFIAIQEDTDEGTKDFIPSTPEEFDEVIDMQIQYQVEQEVKKLEDSWYQTKSPAWQVVAKYAEYASDPSELLPFIQGVKTVDTVANINEEEIDGAEQIVRTRLQQRGDTQDVIEEQIEALKTTDKLISTAKKYKPVILQEEKRHLNQMMAQKQQQEQEYHKMVESIRDNAIKAIDSPIYGKQTLKKEDKLAVYELIGEPDERSHGFRLYSAIDQLFEKGKFETLTKLALLVANEEALVNYISAGASDKTAASLERKIRLATDSRNSSGKDVNSDTPTLQRQPYNPRSGGFRRQ